MKVLATDLDGTLFYPKDKKNLIDGNNLKLIRDFADDGNKIVLISGRSLDFLKKVQRKINRQCSLISFNGALIYDDKIIASKTISNEIAKQIIDSICIEYDLPGVFIMTSKGVFINLRRNIIYKSIGKIYYRLEKSYAENYDFNESHFNTELEHGAIYKIMLFFGVGKKNKEKAGEVNKILRNTLDNYEASWSNNVIEVTAKDCTKANALLRLVESEDINKDDVIVVGDSGNDISMFKEFYENSYCMGHSSNLVKKYAKTIVEKFSDLSLYIFKK